MAVEVLLGRVVKTVHVLNYELGRSSSCLKQLLASGSSSVLGWPDLRLCLAVGAPDVYARFFSNFNDLVSLLKELPRVVGVTLAVL